MDLNESGMTSVEANWLAWAWSVVAETPSSHLTLCQQVGGAIADPVELNPSYVGSGYRPGGLMVASLVWGAGRDGPGGRVLRKVRTDWLKERAAGTPSADRTFIEAWRTAVITDPDSEPYWSKRIGWFVEQMLGLDRRDIAIATMAVCKLSQNGQGEQLARLCQSTHSFSRLVAALEPAVIVSPTTLVPKVLDVAVLREPPLLIPWNGLTFMLGGERRDEWAPRLAKEARKRLANRGAAGGNSSSSAGLGPVWNQPQPPAAPDTIEPGQADPDTVGRGVTAHYDTLVALVQAVTASGGTPRDSLPACPYDLAWMTGSCLVVAEVKSTTVANENHQIRYGLGQVLGYRHQLHALGHDDVHAVLVVEREPTSPFWLSACSEAGVVLAWPGQLDRLPGMGE